MNDELKNTDKGAASKAKTIKTVEKKAGKTEEKKAGKLEGKSLKNSAKAVNGAVKKPSAKTTATTAAKKSVAGAKNSAAKKSGDAKSAKMSTKRKRTGHEDDFGLKFYMQPIYKPQENNIYGYECLLRIVDKDLGTLTPGMFLDVAKKNPSLLSGLESWTLNELFTVVHKFRENKKYIDMLSINVDVASIQRKDYHLMVASYVDKLTENVFIELPEDAFFSSDENIIENIKEIRGLGIGIAVDNFSANFLTFDWGDELPFDVIKIDKSYIDLFLISPKARLIVEKIKEFADRYQLPLIAVGVENAEQEHALLELGIGKMQGYYYSKPLSVRNVIANS